MDLLHVLVTLIPFVTADRLIHFAKIIGVDVKLDRESPTLPLIGPPCLFADNGANNVESPSPTIFHLNNTETSYWVLPLALKVGLKNKRSSSPAVTPILEGADITLTFSKRNRLDLKLTNVLGENNISSLILKPWKENVTVSNM